MAGRRHPPVHAPGAPCLWRPVPLPRALLALPVGGQCILGAVPTQDVGTGIVAELPGDAVVVDPRAADAWAAGHTQGAANVPWTEPAGFDEEGLW